MSAGVPGDFSESLDTDQCVSSDAIQSTVNDCLSNLKPGIHVRYRDTDDGQYHTVSVICSAGKKKGPNKFWYNEKEGDREFSVDLSRMEEVQTDTGLEVEEVNVVMVPKVDHHKPEIVEAKAKELQMWKAMSVYEEVPDVGQTRIQTSWLISEKDGGYKARLVVRGDQENSCLQVDSPTCSKVAIRIFVTIAVSKEFRVSTKDVKSAFLQGKGIDRIVYVDTPPEMRKPFVIWKLKKVAYGLGDAT